jgi:hypothetical protein
MFRIVCDPSSGSIEPYLTEIRSGSLMFVMCLVGVWQHNLEPVVCVYRTQIPLVQNYAYDPQYVGVIFNFMYFKLLCNVDFNL